MDKHHTGENSIKDTKAESIEENASIDVANSIDKELVEPNDKDTPACPLCGFKSNCKTKSNRQTVLKTHVKTCRGADKGKNSAPQDRNISTPETDFENTKENTPVNSCNKCHFTTKHAESLKDTPIGRE